MIIKSISHRDAMLHQVIALGDKNKQTLGMLPEGAFHQHARNKTILAAIDEGKLAGYLLYRISQKKRLVSITHLCVATEYQGKGISVSLLQELKLKYKEVFTGIMLTCRADYQHASKLWEKFGFKPRTRKRSRAKKAEYYLVKWIYDFGNPNLFSDIAIEDQKIRAVLDSSALIPLSESEAKVNEDVSALTADWLEEHVEYICTQEIFNELNRDENFERAQKTRDFLKKFEVLSFKPDLRDEIVQELRLLIKGTTPNDESDRKQLAETISAGVTHFITLDQKLLDLSETLYEKYSLEVVRPVEFVILIDEISNSFDYRSFRLAGANYDTAKLRSEDLETLVHCFCGSVVNETKQDLRKVISECARDIGKGLVKVIRDRKAEPIAIYGLQFTESEVIIKLLRVKKSNISSVLFQQLIRDVILLSMSKGLNIIVVKELNLADDEKFILNSLGFDFNGREWEKVCLPGIRSLEDILSDPRVKQRHDTPKIAQDIATAAGSKDTLILEFERKLWPLKIVDLEIPVYIIPIRPLWASQLFDFYLANVSLFGASETLAWNRENIYYRSVHPVSERAPGRILWYVSSEEKIIGRSKGIVATSYLDEVYVDRAKEIFRKYRRYGVYEWKDIYSLAGGAILSEIKALKFSDTEVFKNIIPLHRINDIMLKHGRPKNTFASPVEVSNSIFKEIYEIGVQ